MKINWDKLVLDASGYFVDLDGFIVLPQPPRSIELKPCFGLTGPCVRFGTGFLCARCAREFAEDPDAYK